MLEAVMHMPLDIVVTTLLLFVPAVVPGAVIGVLLHFARPHRWVRGAILLGGAVMWFLLVKRLEVSYLDFIVGGYAIAAGAIAGAIAADRRYFVRWHT